MKNNDKTKVLFVYKEEQEYKIESLWAIKKDNLYQINNIPFFINNIALGDIVSIENDEGELYFDELIQESGNSTVQLISFSNKSQGEIGAKFEELGCSWEGSHLPKYISICIPKNVDFLIVKKLLDDGLKNNNWDYKEACISSIHKESLTN